ncbi:hypothetical protein GRI89_13030 [Altererythrobacter salegens]|uniref:Lipoprotein n=1 Tax=Croceibacterium salegens TaxID=1737568 RepID=A0A6I4T1B2_9SPHN|nr:hypothetical protein [Croceibacterium salegens]
MNLADRRSLLRLAGVAALGSCVSASFGVRAASPGGFRPPVTPLRYTRRIVRELAGGYSFAATRSFAVTFASRGSGFVLDGSQIAVDVSAPERIAALAEIERQRIETGLFPIVLDAGGMIAGGPEQRLSAELDRAVAEARRLLADKERDEGEQAAAEQFVQMVHRVGIGLGAQLPRDLFAPAEGERVDRQAIALPNDESGEVTVTFSAESDPFTRLMRRAQRDIVTTVEGDSRTTREDWTLGPF